MNKLRSILSLYTDGFRGMTVGRQLWALIIIKVIIFFGILKLFFFPDVVKQKTADGATEPEVVRTEILNRANN